MTRLALIAVAAAALGGVALSQPAPAHACQYLGENYPVQYDCTQNQPWLPYGTYDNPPAGGANPVTDCSNPINQHNQSCSRP